MPSLHSPAGTTGPAARMARAATYGFSTDKVPPAAFTAKPGSHDDGPGHGMFLGPIGGPAFSRDLTGRFSRWHLQPGTHVLADVDSAFLAVHWELDGEHHHRLLRAGDTEHHETAVLFPLSHERFTGTDLPFVLTLSVFSPVIPELEEAAGLPLTVLDVHLEPAPGTGALPPVDVAFFWPNLNGWKASWVTSGDRGDRAWPGHHHAGNVNVAGETTVPGTAVLQRREPAPGGEQRQEVCLSVTGPGDAFSRQVQYQTGQHATGVPEAEQHFTLGAVRHGFATTGRLGTTPDGSWPAHWHEPVGSAVAAHFRPGGAAADARFVLAFDWPEVRFGAGRTWQRRYSAGDTGPMAMELAITAHQQADEWLSAIDAWHERTLARLMGAGWSPAVAGGVVNELGLVTALGTAWVAGTAPGHEPPSHTPLAQREHLGLLEGLDEGYFYYNTTDLWHYAFPALTLTWPRLAESVFTDLADALSGEEAAERPVYRVAELRPILRAHRLPHDLGSAPEDPFVRLNGYVMRDDPNSWRDATPGHVLARLLHARLANRPLDDGTWRRLRAAAELVVGDDVSGVLPHEEFGDSTWDNLALRGRSTYIAALYTGMWAVLAAESRKRGQDTAVFERRRDAAAAVLDGLWNGEFFRAASEGKYTGAVMPDSIWGLFYADLCGAPTGVAPGRLRGHLRAAYEVCHQGYDDGRVGPLLIGERGVSRYSQDGGEELQVNEVLLGSGWMFAAMLRHYGLHEAADDVAGRLREVLYGGTGLQFRTPAAVDRDGHFRAPLNLRPLAAWWLAVVADPSR